MEEQLTDRAAERACLSGIISHGNNGYVEIKDIITPECFSPANRVIFLSIDNIYQKNDNAVIDLPLLYSSAQEIGLYDSLRESGKYVASLFNLSVDFSNLREFARKLKKFYYVKQLIGKFDDTVKTLNNISGSESISEISSLAETPIFNFLSQLLGDDHQIKHIHEGLDEYLESLDPNKEYKGIPIGFPKLEEAIGYLTHGVHVIAALMKTGKSAIALNAALNASAKFKIPVLFADTELKPEQGVWDRLLARMTQVNVNDIRFGFYKNDEQQTIAINKAANMLRRVPFDYVNITGKTWEEFLQIIRRWVISKVGYDSKGKINDCLVVYDYIKMTDSSSLTAQLAEHQQLGFLLSALHNVSTEYNFPILAFAQLNREQDVASSMRIQWFCSSYSTMSRKNPECVAEDGPQNGNIQIQPKYCRFGPGMPPNEYINYHFDGKICKFVELKTTTEIRRDVELNQQLSSEEENDG